MDEYERRFLEGLQGQRIGGRYVVERVIGSGGMGLVAAARHPELEQEVAIKFMRMELAADPILSARFLREARVAARAKSPHFVRVFDFGKLDSGVPYLVMEMLHGSDLGALLSERGALPVEQAVDYLLQAMLGLAEIHALGGVHRDLKPANLFVAEAAGTRTLKVLDLGLVKESSTGLTSTGHSFGTPHYMSPEQIRESKSVDPRSDIWAIGVILHELLSQSLPFAPKATATGEVFGAILHTEPERLRSVKPELPQELQDVVDRCLRRSPDERFQNLGELARALAPFAGPASRERVAAVGEALRGQPSGSATNEASPLSAQPTVRAGDRGKGADLPAPAPLAVASSKGPAGPVPPRIEYSAVPAVSGSPPVAASRRPTLAIVAGVLVAIGAAATFAMMKLASPRASAAATSPSPPIAAPAATTTSVDTSSSPIGLAPAPSASIPPLAPVASSAPRPAPRPTQPPAKPVPNPASGNQSPSVLDGLDRK